MTKYEKDKKNKKKKSWLEAEIMMFIQNSIKTVAEEAVKDVVKSFKYK